MNETVSKTSLITHEQVDALPRGNFRFIALDVETANGQSSSICQIGIACVDSDHHIQSYSVYVNPETDFAPFNIQLHGIGPNTVRDALTFPQIWRDLFPLLQNHHLVQHSNFDKTAIAASCRKYRLPPPDLSWSDSVKIARKAWPDLKGNGGHGLANLKKTLNLDFHHHDAGEDARAAASVVLHAEDHLSVRFEQLSPTARPIQLSFSY